MPNSTIAIIAACDRNRVIGYKGKMPWYFPEDLIHFKQLTTGHTVIMGRKTFEAIGKPLAERTNIVLSKDPSFHSEECRKAETLEEAFTMTKDELIFIIGGMQVYQQCLSLADILYLTEIDAEFQGDAYFPEFDPYDYEQTLLKTTELPYHAKFIKYQKK